MLEMVVLPLKFSWALIASRSKLEHHLFEPISEGIGFQLQAYSNGANFAIPGAATLPRDVPFALHIQVQEFLYFRDRSLELIDQGFLNSDHTFSLQSISVIPQKTKSTGTNEPKMRTIYMYKYN